MHAFAVTESALVCQAESKLTGQEQAQARLDRDGVFGQPHPCVVNGSPPRNDNRVCGVVSPKAWFQAARAWTSPGIA